MVIYAVYKLMDWRLLTFDKKWYCGALTFSLAVLRVARVGPSLAPLNLLQDQGLICYHYSIAPLQYLSLKRVDERLIFTFVLLEGVFSTQFEL